MTQQLPTTTLASDFKAISSIIVSKQLPGGRVLVDIPYDVKDDPRDKFDKRQPIAVAVDVEKLGNWAECPVVQIGVAYGQDEKVIWTTTFSFPYELFTAVVEPRCKAEFWDQQPGLYERIYEHGQRKGKEPALVWKAFAEWWKKWDSFEKVTFVGDNLEYDYGALNHGLLTFAGRKQPARCSEDGAVFRQMRDPGMMAIGLGQHVRGYLKSQADKLVPHTHWAADDAANILMRFFLFHNYILVLDNKHSRTLRLIHDEVIKVFGPIASTEDQKTKSSSSSAVTAHANASPYSHSSLPKPVQVPVPTANILGAFQAVIPQQQPPLLIIDPPGSRALPILEPPETLDAPASQVKRNSNLIVQRRERRQYSEPKGRRIGSIDSSATNSLNADAQEFVSETTDPNLSLDRIGQALLMD